MVGETTTMCSVLTGNDEQRSMTGETVDSPRAKRPSLHTPSPMGERKRSPLAQSPNLSLRSPKLSTRGRAPPPPPLSHISPAAAPSSFTSNGSNSLVNHVAPPPYPSSPPSHPPAPPPPPLPSRPEPETSGSPTQTEFQDYQCYVEPQLVKLSTPTKLQQQSPRSNQNASRHDRGTELFLSQYYKAKEREQES